MMGPSDKSARILGELQAFMAEHIYPNEVAHQEALAGAENRFASMPLVESLKDKARSAGLWNLFVPTEYEEYSDHGGMSFLDYAPLAEEMGRVIWCPEVFNCNAPDTGNMEVLMKFGTEAQKAAWLQPLLAGEIRSSYAMTEPQVASSDATNIQLDIRRDGDEWVLNGHKWFITGAPYERCTIFIVMGKSDAENPNRHLQQTQILVPKNTAGVEVLRPLTTLGYDDAPIGHAEVTFTDVRGACREPATRRGQGI
jgi:acyl-CoA dehydrogenase